MQVLRKKKDIKILHLENIYVIIVYKERGEIMGLFSKSKPKESEWVEWHPSAQAGTIKRVDYNEKTNNIKSGVTWSAAYDFANFQNILFCIDEMGRQFKNLSDKMDKLIDDNQELKERCELLEKEAEIKKR